MWYITSPFTISAARLRILFIFCTHNIISVSLSFSVTFSFLASDFTVSSNSNFALWSISARYELSMPAVKRLYQVSLVPHSPHAYLGVLLCVEFEIWQAIISHLAICTALFFVNCHCLFLRLIYL